MPNAKKGAEIFNEIMESIDMLEFVKEQMKKNPMNEVCCYEETVTTDGIEIGKERFLRERYIIMNPSKKIYKCEMCSSTGTIINFYSNFHDVSFYQAVRSLDKIYELNLFKGLTNKQIRKVIKSVEICNNNLLEETDTLIFDLK